jgi:serine/threonine protein kinase
VLVDSRGQARLTDFGLAITLNATVASATLLGIGTPYYLAPELLEVQMSGIGDGTPTKASDVYALAVTSWHVRVPYVIDVP